MKKVFGSVFGIGLVLGIAALALAGDYQTYMCTVTNNINTLTNTVTSVTPFEGNVDAIHVDVESGWTGTVTVTSGGQTLLTASGISADATYYTRVAPVNNAGGSLGTTNEFVRFNLGYSQIAVQVSSTQTITTNNVKVKVTMEK